MALVNILSALCLMLLILTPFVVAKNTPQDYLNAHNAVRAQVGVQPLFWDEDLANYAKNHIKKCEMVHSNGHYGENLATVKGKLTAAAAVRAWADEKKFYDPYANACVGGECKHYTQLVWKKTFLVGCASVKCKDNWSLVSCNYSPAGNVVGELPY